MAVSCGHSLEHMKLQPTGAKWTYSTQAVTKQTLQKRECNEAKAME